MNNLKKFQKLAHLVLLAVNFLPAYYPGSPDRNLSVLGTHEISAHGHLWTRFNHRFEESIWAKNEHNPVYTLFGLDGSANIYIDASLGLFNLLEFTLSRQRSDKIYGLEIKSQLLNQRVDRKWISAAVSLNTQLKTSRLTRDADRFSPGLQMILARSFFRQKIELVYNGYYQLGTREGSGDPSGTAANGAGLMFRLNRVTLFGEWIFPMDTHWSYTKVGSDPLQAYGFNYRIYKHSFALFATNYTDIHNVNFLTGADSQDWVNSLKFGFNITRTFWLFP